MSSLFFYFKLKGTIKMPETINELLLELANQLQVSVPLLWEAMVRRTQALAAIELVFHTFVITIFCGILNTHSSLSSDNEIKIVFSVVSWIIFGIYVIIYIMSFPNMITNFMFPEYSTLHNLIQMF